MADPSPLAGQQRLVLFGATLIDGRGGPPLPAARVIIEGDRFSCISGPEGCPGRSGDREQDLTGHWLIPGLIDTHVHLRFDQDAQAMARNQRLRFALGITTTRDGGSPSVDSLLARKVTGADSRTPVPRLLVTGLLTREAATGAGVEDGAALARHWRELGVDAIKLKPQPGDFPWQEVLQAAREAGLPSFGHTATGPDHAFSRAAVAEGISGISHLMWFPIDARGANPPAGARDTIADEWVRTLFAWVEADQAILDSLAAEMVAAGTWLEPNVAVEYHAGRPLVPPDHLQFLNPPRRLRQHLPLWAGGLPRPRREAGPRYPEPWAREARFVRDFMDRGGTIVAGGDERRPGLDLHEEMRLLAEVAGRPMAGLLAATRDAARILRREDLGTIEPGKLADAVILAADPLATAGATLHAVQVVKGGVTHDVAMLLEPFREEHAALVWAAWRGRLARAGLAALLALSMLAAMRVLMGRVRGRQE